MAWKDKNYDVAYKANYYKENKETIREKSKAYRQSVAGRKAKKRSIVRTYGLTLEDYEKMLEEQNNLCKICNEPETEKKSLAIDHDHNTGKGRGLLCSKCNKGIGLLRDNPELLRIAANYLQNN